VTSPTPRRRLARDDRARQLVEVAEVVIAERGIHAAAMDEIADRAGVTKPVVYDHFGSKDGLVAAVVLRAGAQLAETVLSAVEGAADPEHALADGVSAYFHFMADRQSSWAALLTGTATSSAAAAALEQVRDQQAELIAGLVSDDVPDCDLPRARLYAQVVIGACERLATRPVGDSSPTITDLTRHVMDVIWTGFRGVRDGQRWAAGSSG
jgi:AcrR family transcriptional regulator